MRTPDRGIALMPVNARSRRSRHQEESSAEFRQRFRGPWRLILAGLCAVALPVLGAIIPATAQAKSFAFCPNTPGNTISLGPYYGFGGYLPYDRCAATYSQYITFIKSTQFDNYGVCAINKPNPDGTGANLGNWSCSNGVAYAYPNTTGHPTIINHTAYPHNRFEGGATNNQ